MEPPSPEENRKPSTAEDSAVNPELGPTPSEPAAHSESGVQEGTPRIPGLRIQQPLGAGAMGEVYAAVQEYVNREVAVKLLGERYTGSSYQDRFKREATILAGLSHENIVGCYDAGVAPDGRCYLVMEWVRGPALDVWLKEHGALGLEPALQLTLDLARALQYAHDEHGIIHRDVKPGNVLLSPAEEGSSSSFPYSAKLSDLGLARPVQTQSQDMALTADGMILGTPSTMAPEQFDDPSGVDARVDMYALGCVLFHVLTGEAAFRGRRMATILQAKLNPKGPNPCKVKPSLPKSIGILAARMMAPERKDRPESYGVLISEIEGLQRQIQKQTGQSKVFPRAKVGSLLGVALLLSLSGYWWARPTPQAQEKEVTGTDSALSESTPSQPDPLATGSETGAPSAETSEERKSKNGLPKPVASQVFTPTVVTLPERLIGQAGNAVTLAAQVDSDPDALLHFEWSWGSNSAIRPELQRADSENVSFVAPALSEVMELPLVLKVTLEPNDPAQVFTCVVSLYPAPRDPLESDVSLVDAEDFGGTSRYWSWWEGGRQFGPLLADEGIFCRSKNQAVHGIELPGGSWSFHGRLAVSNPDSPPHQLGLVLLHPHGRRHELLLGAGTETSVMVQSLQRSSPNGSWETSSDAILLGTVSMMEEGVPVVIRWKDGQLRIEVGVLSHAINEPVAPDGLGFKVKGGAGELREPMLSPH